MAAKYKIGMGVLVNQTIEPITEVVQTRDGVYYGTASGRVKESDIKEVYNKVVSRKSRTKKANIKLTPESTML